MSHVVAIAKLTASIAVLLRGALLTRNRHLSSPVCVQSFYVGRLSSTRWVLLRQFSFRHSVQEKSTCDPKINTLGRWTTAVGLADIHLEGDSNKCYGRDLSANLSTRRQDIST